MAVVKSAVKPSPLQEKGERLMITAKERGAKARNNNLRGRARRLSFSDFDAVTAKEEANGKEEKEREDNIQPSIHAGNSFQANSGPTERRFAETAMRGCL